MELARSPDAEPARTRQFINRSEGVNACECDPGISLSRFLFCCSLYLQRFLPRDHMLRTHKHRLQVRLLVHKVKVKDSQIAGPKQLSQDHMKG